jgi:hypothetical protein
MSIWPGNHYPIRTSDIPIDQSLFNEGNRKAIQRRFTEWWIDSLRDIALITRPCRLDDTLGKQVTSDDEEQTRKSQNFEPEIAGDLKT